MANNVDFYQAAHSDQDSCYHVAVSVLSLPHRAVGWSVIVSFAGKNLSCDM